MLRDRVDRAARRILLLWSNELIPLLYGSRWLSARPLVAAITLNMAVGVVMRHAAERVQRPGSGRPERPALPGELVLTYALAAGMIRPAAASRA